MPTTPQEMQGAGIGDSYTLTPEMVADAARSFSPKILYPYHSAKQTRPISESFEGSPGH